MVVVVAAVAAYAVYAGGGLPLTSAPACYLDVQVTSTNPPMVKAIFHQAAGQCSVIFSRPQPYQTHFTWGDGASSDVRGADIPGIVGTHQYSSVSIYTVTGNVTDGNGKWIGTWSATANLFVPLTIGWNSTANQKQVVFHASILGGTPPYNLNWDFGDGSSTNTANLAVSHAYASFGTYMVKLQVTDSSSPYQVQALGMSINLAGPPPLAVSFTCNTNGWKIACSAAANGGVGPYTFAWKFGDGSSATGQYVNHTYASNGTYTVTIAAADSLGSPASAQSSVTVTYGPSGCTSNCTSPTLPTPQVPPMNAFPLRQVLGVILAASGAVLVAFMWQIRKLRKAFPAFVSFLFLLAGSLLLLGVLS